jgi:hypothetical protein
VKSSVAKGSHLVFSSLPVFNGVAIRGDEARDRVPHNGLKARLNFSRSFLRSGKILLQNRAILRNVLQTTFVRLTYDSQCCATQRKRAQFVSFELEIRCSIQLSYGRRTTNVIPRFANEQKVVNLRIAFACDACHFA